MTNAKLQKYKVENEHYKIFVINMIGGQNAVKIYKKSIVSFIKGPVYKNLVLIIETYL